MVQVQDQGFRPRGSGPGVHGSGSPPTSVERVSSFFFFFNFKETFYTISAICT